MKTIISEFIQAQECNPNTVEDLVIKVLEKIKLKREARVVNGMMEDIILLEEIQKHIDLIKHKE